MNTRKATSRRELSVSSLPAVIVAIGLALAGTTVAKADARTPQAHAKPATDATRQHAGDDRAVSIEDYRRAESMLARNLSPKLLNSFMRPIWLPDGDGFWYQHETANGGWDYVAVDPVARTKRPAFDHATLAAAISKATSKPVDAAHLPLDTLAFAGGDPTRIAFTADGMDVTCNLSNASCAASPTPVPDNQVVASPNKQFAVFARDDNLWLRTIATGKERQLTKDGEPYFSYGKVPAMSLLRVASGTVGFKLPLYGVEWSPDSRHLVVTRTDERKLQDYNFIQMAPFNGDRHPKVVSIRIPLAGETDLVSQEVSIVDTQSGSRKVLDVGPSGLSIEHNWDPTGGRFMAIQGNYSRKETLYEVSVETGVARAVLVEENKTFLQTSPLTYDEQAVRFLPSTNEMIWYSQRDGLNHLYLVDIATGAIKNKITIGDWNVQNIIRVDERARRIYFTAAGREAGENPYWRHLYAADLDGRNLTLITPEPGDHNYIVPINREVAMSTVGLATFATPVLISPSGRYVVDTFSTVTSPPVSVVRSTAGALVMPLETADATAAYAAGWIAPEPFMTKAADGKTDLYGIIFKPAHFDPKRRYPVIDGIYNGPQVVSTPNAFGVGMFGSADAQAFAQLGFVVIRMDSRGTPMRTKAFQDYAFNNFQEFGLEDHVAAIKQLAATHPYMDASRVGIYGHSFGGYATMKGILGYPDVFKVAAASAGPYDLYGFYPLDFLFEQPLFKNGTSHPSGPADRPTNWGAIDFTQQAGQLKGKLMLAYGELDENAFPAVSVRMVNALIAANKSFDLIFMPNRSHGFAEDPYFIRRRWDFFVRNLLGKEPPENYTMGTLH